jgi:hypothetical protein
VLAEQADLTVHRAPLDAPAAIGGQRGQQHGKSAANAVAGVYEHLFETR